jgi:hypothetical protein
LHSEHGKIDFEAPTEETAEGASAGAVVSARTSHMPPEQWSPIPLTFQKSTTLLSTVPRPIEALSLSSREACPSKARAFETLHNLSTYDSSIKTFGFIIAGSIPNGSKALSLSAAERLSRSLSISSLIASTKFNFFPCKIVLN